MSRNRVQLVYDLLKDEFESERQRGYIFSAGRARRYVAVGGVEADGAAAVAAPGALPLCVLT